MRRHGRSNRSTEQMQKPGFVGLVLILISSGSWALAGDEPSNGLVATTSPHGVAETADRTEAAVE